MESVGNINVWIAKLRDVRHGQLQDHKFQTVILILNPGRSRPHARPPA